jgi:hypothetical protein
MCEWVEADMGYKPGWVHTQGDKYGVFDTSNTPPQRCTWKTVWTQIFASKRGRKGWGEEKEEDNGKIWKARCCPASVQKEEKIIKEKEGRRRRRRRKMGGKKWERLAGREGEGRWWEGQVMEPMSCGGSIEWRKEWNEEEDERGGEDNEAGEEGREEEEASGERRGNKQRKRKRKWRERRRVLGEHHVCRSEEQGKDCASVTEEGRGKKRRRPGEAVERGRWSSEGKKKESNHEGKKKGADGGKKKRKKVRPHQQRRKGGESMPVKEVACGRRFRGLRCAGCWSHVSTPLHPLPGREWGRQKTKCPEPKKKEKKKEGRFGT